MLAEVLRMRGLGRRRGLTGFRVERDRDCEFRRGDALRFTRPGDRLRRLRRDFEEEVEA